MLSGNYVIFLLVTTASPEARSRTPLSSMIQGDLLKNIVDSNHNFVAFSFHTTTGEQIVRRTAHSIMRLQPSPDYSMFGKKQSDMMTGANKPLRPL